ncbi:MAG: hypothetical protein ACF8LK_06780 [Phycisphaerales bacterium JB041]
MTATHSTPRRLLCGLAAAGFLAAALPAHAQRSRKPEPSPHLQPSWEWLKEAPKADDDHLIQGAGPGVAAFDTVLPELDTTNLDDLIYKGLAVRLDAQLTMLTKGEREPLIEFLQQHESLAAEMAFLLVHQDNIGNAYRVLARLIEAHGEKVAELAPLAAAICAVHDDPKPRHVNENTVPMIDAVELFGYFADNERSMLFDLENTPATLLLFVADANGTLNELEWARRRYGRDRNVGNRYQEITYDHAAFETDGAVKKVTASGDYSLPSIREHGGICADQAYFAMTVGKAAGVPAVYVRGKGGDVSHAWLGFLERASSRAARWNFDAGRYPSYEDLRGKVLEPQTWTEVPDADLSIAGLSTWVRPEARFQSIVLTDAALRLGVVAWQEEGPEAMNADLTARQLEVLERALRLDSGNVRAWMLARARLASDLATLEQREHWANATEQLAGRTAPDFAFDMYEAMFNAVADPEVRYTLWDWAVTRFGDRMDLPAKARVYQINILIEQDKPEEAYKLARSAFEKYHKGGEFALEALRIAERLVAERGDTKATLDLYRWAFSKPRTPGKMQPAFLRQTTWFKVGSRYLSLLLQAGDQRTANAVRRQLDR